MSQELSHKAIYKARKAGSSWRELTLKTGLSQKRLDYIVMREELNQLKKKIVMLNRKIKSLGGK